MKCRKIEIVPWGHGHVNASPYQSNDSFVTLTVHVPELIRPFDFGFFQHRLPVVWFGLSFVFCSFGQPPKVIRLIISCMIRNLKLYLHVIWAEQRILLTLFFPLRRISLQRVSCSSVNSCFDSRSLNSSIGSWIMSITEIGNLPLWAKQETRK